MKLIPSERIERSILLIRGHKVMLDRDLAELYGVKVGVFNQAVKRNSKRFPDDFMFQLTWEETKELAASRSQSVILKRGSNPKYRPHVFTEQGVAMLSGILNSDRAISVNIEIMRAFVRLRHILATHENLARKLTDLEKKYDKQFAVVFEALRQLMAEDDEKPRKGRIGFHRSR